MIGWLLLCVALLAFVLNVIAPWLLSRLAIDYFEADAVLNPRAAGQDPDAVLAECETSDGIRLSMAVWNGGISEGPVVVFCPEAGGTKWSAAFYAQSLIDSDATVVSFDFRNHGQSGGTPGYRPSHWLSAYEVRDVRAVIEWVRSRPQFEGREVVLFGVSRGACAALYAAAIDVQIRRIVADGAYPTRALMMRYLKRWGTLKVPQWVIDYVPAWHLQLTLDFARMASGRRRGCRYLDLRPIFRDLRSREILFIAGKRDSYVPTDVTLEVAVATGTPDDRVWVVPKARHNEAREVAPEMYDERIGSFLLGPSFAREVTVPDARAVGVASGA